MRFLRHVAGTNTFCIRSDRFIRFSCVIFLFHTVCVCYLYGSYVTRPLLVLYTSGSRTVIVRFMRFILRSWVPPGARISISTTEQPRVINKNGKRKVQVPQSQTAALPRHQEEEETDKSKQAQIEQTYEKH